MATKPSPKTAIVTVEVTNDDGSKRVVTTEPLDATRLSRNPYPNPSNSPEHVVLGMVDPWCDDRQDTWFDNDRVVPTETHFSLQVQLPPVKRGKVYTIQEIPAPDTRVIMMYHTGLDKIQLTNWTEEDLPQKIASAPGVIYFFLDIPQ